ncbi:MAG: glycosyltransferase family 4 protein [Pseudomonadota bacterium]
MKLLIVTQYFWPENFPINDLVAGLVDRGHRVTVFTGRPNYPGGRLFDGYGPVRPWRETHAGASVVRVPLVPRGAGGGVRLFVNYLSFAVAGAALGPLVVPKDIDAIFVYEPSPISVGIPAMALKAVTGAPVLFWLQDLWPESLSATGAITASWALKTVEMMVRLLYKGCDRILVQSRAFIPAVRRLGGAPDRIRYFPNNADTLYRPVTVRAGAPERRLMPNGFRLTFAGNVGAAQDFDTIIGAAERLRDREDIHFVIIGDGRMHHRVTRAVARKSLTRTVHLLGRYPADRMPTFFALSDALLVSLRSDPIFSISIPSKVQAYMACGRPIVAALDGEGARIIETAGAGLVCPTQSPARLAETVRAMAGLSETARQAMGNNGRRFFEAEFEREMLIDRLEGWIGTLTSGTGRQSNTGKTSP